MSDWPAWYSKGQKMKATRALVKMLPCPECGAQAGQKCIGARGQPRTAMHSDRWDLYRERRDATVQ